MINIIGKEPIHPVLFYSGKASGYTTWILLLLSVLGVIHVGRNPVYALVVLSYLVAVAGLCLSMVSIVNLGSSTRLGLPAETTAFKTNGLYRLSRNPMYVGFNLITVSSTIYHGSVLILALAA